MSNLKTVKQFVSPVGQTPLSKGAGGEKPCYLNVSARLLYGRVRH